MNLLIDHNAAIVVCGNNHLPNGMFLNLNSHHIQQEIFRNQMEASLPLKKQLWQQTTMEKIRNQGQLLERITGEKNSFEFLMSKVLSGDTSNMEGVAANMYWKTFFCEYNTFSYGLDIEQSIFFEMIELTNYKRSITTSGSVYWENSTNR